MKAINLQVEDTDIGMYLLCNEFLLDDCYPITLVPNRDEIRRSEEEDEVFAKPVQFYLNKKYKRVNTIDSLVIVVSAEEVVYGNTVLHCTVVNTRTMSIYGFVEYGKYYDTADLSSFIKYFTQYISDTTKAAVRLVINTEEVTASNLQVILTTGENEEFGGKWMYYTISRKYSENGNYDDRKVYNISTSHDFFESMHYILVTSLSVMEQITEHEYHVLKYDMYDMALKHIYIYKNYLLAYCVTTLKKLGHITVLRDN